jgi:TrmH family RNA methyltransferase
MANPIPSIAIVLDRTQNPANIGAVVRAMKNMGFNDLRLVNPAPFARKDLLRYAHRCDDLVASLTVHATLDEALADTIFVVGTAALQHPDRPTTSDVRALAADLLSKAQSGVVALLFGTEADGLDRAALDRCHLVASLPVNPDYPALNLAQSVLIFLHEMRMANELTLHAPSSSDAAPAPQAELTQLFDLTEEVLTAINYFRYNPETVMRSLRQIAYRAELTSAETAMLIGIARKVLHARNPD